MVLRMMILLMSLLFCFSGTSAWADDDAIIDIDNHVASFSGTWGTNNTPILFYGDDFRWAACSGGDSSYGTITAEATFSSQQVGIAVDITGVYMVYVRWVAHPNRTDSARYRIFDGTTQVGSCTLYQRSRGGEWVYCDTVNLTSGHYAVVKLGNNCESGKYVIADAVRFVRVSKDEFDIVDEPGVTYYHNTSSVTIASTSSASPTQIASKSITCPGSGYVVAIATGQPNIYASAAGSWVKGYFSLNTSATWDSVNYQEISSYETTTSSHKRSLSIIRRDSCSSGGTLTYYLLAYRNTAAASGSYVWQPTITLMYFPTQY